MSRIDDIRELLAERGPMTVTQIAHVMGISEATTNAHLHAFRKREKGIRITGYMKTGPTKKHRLYGIGHEPDAEYPNPRRAPSAVKRIKYPGMTREEIADRKRRRELSRQTKPFRDPLIWATAGRSV